ncbi:hypothetical protein HPB49_009811 [Dermacentor silvarum]|uniref:Uncharacterized protein n=1 Tax=Dermacentor silvarum TaxID=543639 RepID=A0ACB8DCS2_DERSI|nr:hypothetical protein HPB49_009811 [Dermacentor silvarum]
MASEQAPSRPSFLPDLLAADLSPFGANDTSQAGNFLGTAGYAGGRSCPSPCVVQSAPCAWLHCATSLADHEAGCPWSYHVSLLPTSRPADSWPRRVTPAAAADLAAGYPGLLFLRNPGSPVTSVVAAAPKWQPRLARSWLLQSGGSRVLLAEPWCCPAPSFLGCRLFHLAGGPSSVRNFGGQGKPLALCQEKRRLHLFGLLWPLLPVLVLRKTTTPSWTLPLLARLSTRRLSWVRRTLQHFCQVLPNLSIDLPLEPPPIQMASFTLRASLPALPEQHATLVRRRRSENAELVEREAATTRARRATLTGEDTDGGEQEVPGDGEERNELRRVLSRLLVKW